MGYGKKAARNIDQRLMGTVSLGPDRRPPSSTARRPPDAARAQSRPPHLSQNLPRARNACESFAEAMVGAARAERSARRGAAAACAATSGKTTTSSKEPPCLKNSPSESTANTSPRPGRPDHSGSGPRQRQVHPHALLSGGLTPVGACRLCIVEVSGVGRLLPACTTPVQDGMSVTTNSEKLHAVPPHGARVPLLGAQSPVRRLRLQQPLRIAGHGAAPRRHQRALSLRLSRSSRWTSRTTATCWTTTAASSARAACGSAPKWKARTSGTSVSRGIRSHDGLRHEPPLGRSRAVAPIAASACRSAPPARWPRRVSPWKRWSRHDSQCERAWPAGAEVVL